MCSLLVDVPEHAEVLHLNGASISWDHTDYCARISPSIYSYCLVHKRIVLIVFSFIYSLRRSHHLFISEPTLISPSVISKIILRSLLCWASRHRHLLPPDQLDSLIGGHVIAILFLYSIMIFKVSDLIEVKGQLYSLSLITSSLIRIQ